MNRTKIEWADYVWNPARGCENRCWYCYGPRICKRWGGDFFTPQFLPERLDQPLKVKQPSKIFVCSMADLFGDWVPDAWIEQVLAIVQRCPRHTFMFLTKNPKRYYDIEFPQNCWLGVTITGKHDNGNEWTRMSDFRVALNHNRAKGFVSFEPLLDNVYEHISSAIKWVIIGALTQVKSTEQGKIKREHVDNLLTYCNRFHIPVFVKDNVGLAFPRREWPKSEIDYMEYPTDVKPQKGF